VLASTLLSVVSTVHLVVRELIGVTSLALHKGAAITYTNEGTQRHERSTIVTFVISREEKIKNPSQ
jgi:hypothetical protein